MVKWIPILHYKLHRHLAHNLRKVESDSVEQAAFESRLAEMATDLEIQAELQEIDREFAVTEADGLKSWQGLFASQTG